MSIVSCQRNVLLSVVKQENLEMNPLAVECLHMDHDTLYYTFKNSSDRRIKLREHRITFREIIDETGIKIDPVRHYYDMRYTSNAIYLLAPNESIVIPYVVNFLIHYDLESDRQYLMSFEYQILQKSAASNDVSFKLPPYPLEICVTDD